MCTGCVCARVLCGCAHVPVMCACVLWFLFGLTDMKLVYTTWAKDDVSIYIHIIMESFAGRLPLKYCCVIMLRLDELTHSLPCYLFVVLLCTAETKSSICSQQVVLKNQLTNLKLDFLLDAL